ncbi:helix-turn-helix domain-containing protein [Desulfonema magnum]|uniref:HTH domain-containing protein, Cro/C1-type n=1 Tax=Desulfonema magnum TaxID=45655 RepID=A0A975BLL4_9BACT|nr:helix-turn-helix transcriptional regulator [Desulfonema magnum]QTA87309.1 HTH domain-containing protein, Cro/C1-type [Desulfonema magnum]
MLAVVKKPRTEETLFRVKGDIPHKVIDYLEKEFGPDFEISDADEEFVDIFETDWYREISAATTPGDVLKIYRENMGLTQAELGRKLGEFTSREISDMEDNKSCISKEVAGKLGSFFEVPTSRFHP